MILASVGTQGVSFAAGLFWAILGLLILIFLIVRLWKEYLKGRRLDDGEGEVEGAGAVSDSESGDGPT
jgi:hypothetical protein